MERWSRKQDAFTLIELMVSLSIFSIISLAVYSSFAGGIATWRRAQEFSSMHQTARLVLDDMAHELKNAILISGTDFVGERQKLSFLTVRQGSHATGRSANHQITKVTYDVQKTRASSDYALSRLESPYAKGGQDDRREPDVLVDAISALDFQYTYKNREGEIPPWKTVWDTKDALPLGVKITLTVAETRFTKTVFIPHGFQEKRDRPTR